MQTPILELLAASGVPSSLIIYLIMRFQRIEAKIDTIETFIGLKSLTIEDVKQASKDDNAD